jgi:hypothetical protein
MGYWLARRSQIEMSALPPTADIGCVFMSPRPGPPPFSSSMNSDLAFFSSAIAHDFTDENPPGDRKFGFVLPTCNSEYTY